MDIIIFLSFLLSHGGFIIGWRREPAWLLQLQGALWFCESLASNFVVGRSGEAISLRGPPPSTIDFNFFPAPIFEESVGRVFFPGNRMPRRVSCGTHRHHPLVINPLSQHLSARFLKEPLQQWGVRDKCQPDMNAGQKNVFLFGEPF